MHLNLKMWNIRMWLIPYKANVLKVRFFFLMCLFDVSGLCYNSLKVNSLETLCNPEWRHACLQHRNDLMQVNDTGSAVCLCVFCQAVESIWFAPCWHGNALLPCSPKMPTKHCWRLCKTSSSVSHPHAAPTPTTFHAHRFVGQERVCEKHNYAQRELS